MHEEFPHCLLSGWSPAAPVGGSGAGPGPPASTPVSGWGPAARTVKLRPESKNNIDVTSPSITYFRTKYHPTVWLGKTTFKSLQMEVSEIKSISKKIHHKNNKRKVY